MSSFRRFLAHASSQSLLLALFFVLLELMKAHRSSQWAGMSGADAAGVLAALGIYAGLLFAGTVLCGAAGMRWPRAAAALGGLAAASVLWVFLSRYREFAPTAEDAMVAAGLAVLTLASLPGWRGGVGGRAAAAGALLAGIAAVHAAGVLFLFDDRRAALVTALPLLWAGFTALVLLSLGWRGARMAPLFTTACALIALPPLVAFAFTRAPARPADAPPNILFIVSDTLRADYLGAHGGHVPTPHLDVLAARGALFERHYALAPWTLPSMTGMFASQYPAGITPGAGHEVWLHQLWYYAVDSPQPTLAERLRERGYTTGALTANAFLPVLPGMMRGFDIQAKPHPILLLRAGLFSHCPFLQDALAACFPRFDPIRPHDTTTALTRYTEAFLRRHRGGPFFLWTHYIDPHSPYDPPNRYRTWAGPWPFYYPYKGGERWGIPILGSGVEVDEKDWPYTASLYEGEIRYIDEFMGRLLAVLEAQGLADSTIVCFTSDHGEELWDHGQWGHGQSLHEELIHVPLLLAGPGIPPARIAGPISAIDLMPTLAGLLGVPPSEDWRGEDLAPVVRGEAPLVPRPVFAQATSNRADPPQQAVIHNGLKLLRNAATGELRLYDLAADPREQHDLSASRPADTETLHSVLLEWLTSFPSTFEIDLDNAPANDDAREHLRGMGYL